MSSTDNYRPDPFSNPFAPTDRSKLPTAQLAEKRRTSFRRPLFLFFGLMTLAMVVSAIWFAPSLRALWRLSDAQGMIADRQEEQAVKQLDQAIEASPNEIELRLARIRLASRLGQMDKAKADLEVIEKYISGLEKTPSLGIRAYRSQFRQMAGEYRKALEDQSSILSEVRDNKATPVEEALHLNNHAYSAGLAVEREPKDATADRELLEKAVEDCDRGLKLAPDQGSTVDTRGYLHFLLGNNEKALADLDKAIEIVGKEVQAGQAEVKGDPRQLTKRLALRELEYSAAVQHQHRMKVHEKMGNEEAAKKDRQAIIDLGYKPDVFLQ